jgi:hypothetical protein
MTHRKIANRIQQLESRQQQDKSRGVIFADKAPDGTFIDPDTGKPIEETKKTPSVVFHTVDIEDMEE